MATAEHKTFNTPEETRPFEKGRVELITIGGATIGRLVLEPGWRWSEHVKPLAGTDRCEAPHFQYPVSGRIHIVMAGSQQIAAGPGDVPALPKGHDAGVVGKEPVVLVDWW